MDEIFAPHTIEGAAATMQMGELSGFTHTVEDVLDEIRSGKVSVNGDMIDLLLSSIDTIKKMLSSRSNRAVYDGDVDALAGRYVPPLISGHDQKMSDRRVR